MIICPICSKHLKQIHGSHLKIHDITTEEFKLKYPSISLRNEKTYQTQYLKTQEQTLKDNIKCLQCNALITGRYRKTKKFCCSSCSATFNNTRKQKTKNVCSQCKCSYQTKCNHSKFCSQQCSSAYRRNRPVEVVCNQCSNTFTKNESRLKRSYKHFCTNLCKKEYYEVNSHERGVYNKHNGRSATSTYRKLAFASYKHECYYCKYDKFIDVLQVHHLDENRNNNSLENLRIVCPTCHSEVHKNYK